VRGADRRRQRLLVLGALLAVVLALLVWPEEQRDAAYAATQPCGPNDANRASLTTGNGVAVRPCLSKVTLNMVIPRTQTSSRGCGTLWLEACYEQGKWQITAIKKQSGQTLKYADGSTESGLYRLTFQQFQVVKDATLNTTGGTGYGLALKPAAAAQLGRASGGSVIYTDLWVTADSTINLSFLTFGCEDNVRPDDVLWTIANAFTSISAGGCGMNLKIRYAVTTSAAADGQSTGVYSVNMPNTTVTVGP